MRLAQFLTEIPPRSALPPFAKGGIGGILSHSVAKCTNVVWSDLAFLQKYRVINPDPPIAEGFSALLEKYAYLKDHLADALIAATAWKKGMEVVTTNPRHFEPIEEIRVKRFPEDF